MLVCTLGTRYLGLGTRYLGYTAAENSDDCNIILRDIAP